MRNRYVLSSILVIVCTIFVGRYVYISAANGVNSARQLLTAVEVNNVRKASKLLNAIDQQLLIDERGRTVIYYAIQNGNLPLLNMLLQAKPELIDQPSFPDSITPLTQAILWRFQHASSLELDLAIISTLLQHNANVNLPGNCAGVAPVSAAILTKNYTVLEMLLKANNYDTTAVDLEVQQAPYYTTANKVNRNSPWYLALHNDDYQAVELLIKYHYLPDTNPEKLISSAIYKRDKKFMDILMAAQLDVNGSKKLRPLNLALETGSRALINYLLEHGADINAVDLAGYAPLDIAMRMGDPGLVALVKLKGGVANLSFSQTKYDLYLRDLAKIDLEIAELENSYKERKNKSIPKIRDTFFNVLVIPPNANYQAAGGRVKLLEYLYIKKASIIQAQRALPDIEFSKLYNQAYVSHFYVEISALYARNRALKFDNPIPQFTFNDHQTYQKLFADDFEAEQLEKNINYRAKALIAMVKASYGDDLEKLS